jgi:hypothetical protein
VRVLVLFAHPVESSFDASAIEARPSLGLDRPAQNLRLLGGDRPDADPRADCCLTSWTTSPLSGVVKRIGRQGLEPHRASHRKVRFECVLE